MTKVARSIERPKLWRLFDHDAGAMALQWPRTASPPPLLLHALAPVLVLVPGHPLLVRVNAVPCAARRIEAPVHQGIKDTPGQSRVSCDLVFCHQPS